MFGPTVQTGSWLTGTEYKCKYGTVRTIVPPLSSLFTIQSEGVDFYCGSLLSYILQSSKYVLKARHNHALISSSRRRGVQVMRTSPCCTHHQYQHTTRGEFWAPLLLSGAPNLTAGVRPSLSNRHGRRHRTQCVARPSPAYNLPANVPTESQTLSARRRPTFPSATLRTGYLQTSRVQTKTNTMVYNMG